MHPVANEVLVPTESVERALLGFAERRFTGRVELSFRVKPEAALDVEVLPPQASETQRIGDRAPSASPNLFRPTGPSERELIVKQLLTANAHRFRLGMKLTGIVCDFKDGNLNSAQWITVG
jgi:hypothetical protein